MLLLLNGLGLMLMPRAMCRRNAMITAESRAQCAAARAPLRRSPRGGSETMPGFGACWQGPVTRNTVLLDPPGCSILGMKPLRMTTHTLRDRILARVRRMQVSKDGAVLQKCNTRATRWMAVLFPISFSLTLRAAHCSAARRPPQGGR